MSESETVDDVSEDPKDIAIQAWVRKELSVNAPSRGPTIGRGRTPVVTERPKFLGAKPTGDKPTGPKIGTERDLEGIFNQKLSQAMEGITIARQTKPPSQKGTVALDSMEKSLSAMSGFVKAKDFPAATKALDDALGSVTELSDERLAAKKAFEDVFFPLEQKLKASGELLKGVPGIDPKVAQAQKIAQDAAALAEKAADDDDWTLADQKLQLFIPLMTSLGTAQTDAAVLLDKALEKSIARLKRREEALKGTALPVKATAAKKAYEAAALARSTANSETSPDARLKALALALDDAKDADSESQSALKEKFNTGAADGLAELRKGAADAIAALPTGDPKKEFLKQLGEWDKIKKVCDDETDPNVKKTALTELAKTARKLMTDALAAKGDLAADAKVQEIYRKALEKRFGLTIVVPPGMTNTHFDQFYEMLDRLPVQQGHQDNLKILRYDASSSGASYNTGLMRVTMGNFTKETKWDYKNPVTGVTEPINAFAINSLHEIGHAVDNKYKIMDANGKNAGCGAWKEETQDTVVAAFLKELKATGGTAITSADNVLNGLISTAITNMTKAKPPLMGVPEWTVVSTLLDKAMKIHEDKWPWGGGSATVTLDGRAYHMAYKQNNSYVSYDPAARTGTEVRDYQFRAPGEWFAELYAYTWFNKKKAPGGVDKAAAKYMYSAKA